jgi:NAD(P)-dependent dehydrogenase (short-subunit alcohol dehydrogenase family)
VTVGPALLAKAAMPHLEATGGRLVLIGSVAGLKNAPANLYSAIKWAVTGLAENLRMHATTVATHGRDSADVFAASVRTIVLGMRAEVEEAKVGRTEARQVAAAAPSVD